MGPILKKIVLNYYCYYSFNFVNKDLWKFVFSLALHRKMLPIPNPEYSLMSLIVTGAEYRQFSKSFYVYLLSTHHVQQHFFLVRETLLFPIYGMEKLKFRAFLTVVHFKVN